MPQSSQSQEQPRRISSDQVQRSHNIPELSEIILSMPAWMNWLIIHRTIYNIYSHQSKCLNLSDFRPLCIFFQDGKECEGSLAVTSAYLWMWQTWRASPPTLTTPLQALHSEIAFPWRGGSLLNQASTGHSNLLLEFPAAKQGYQFAPKLLLEHRFPQS